tara:strand:- start:544 stop:1635 length:1092 start_codon:yes stop_codon:yes gene_type:complete
MRYPATHTFLKWFGPTFVTFIGSSIGLIATLSAPFPRVNAWAEARFDEWSSVLSAPWFSVLCIAAIAAYIWALIYTGQERKTGLAAIKPMSRREKKADDELRRKISSASPDEAKRLMDAAIAKLNAPRRTMWDTVKKIADRSRQVPFLPLLTKQNERAAIGMDETTVEAKPAKAARGADFPKIGKAILDRYDGEVETFAYRKAVLQLSEVKATAMRRAGEADLTRIDCHIDIENHTSQQFTECRVRLVAINGDRLDSDSFLRIGKLKGDKTQTVFAVRPHQSKARIHFMKRNLDDVLSNPPFLLCLHDRDLPLSDSKEYRFIFALESEYEHPTYATIRCFIPEREKVEISLENQSLDLPDEQA